MGYEKHGGNCCGVFHIFDFPENPKWRKGATAQTWLKDTIENGRAAQHDVYYRWGGEDSDTWVEDDEATYAVEAVLAQYQLAAWEPILIAAGFKMVLSFNNTNSGNDCFIFLGITSELKL